MNPLSSSLPKVDPPISLPDYHFLLNRTCSWFGNIRSWIDNPCSISSPYLALAYLIRPTSTDLSEAARRTFSTGQTTKTLHRTATAA